MKALLVDRGVTVFGLGDPADQALFAHTTLGEYVRNACMGAGIEVLPPGAPPPGDQDLLVLPTDLFITRTLLTAWLARPRVGGVERLALRHTPSVDHALPLQDLAVEPLTPQERCTVPGRRAEVERRATHKVLLDAYICRSSHVGSASGDDLLEALATAAQPAVVDKLELVVDMRLPLLPMEGTEPPRMRFPLTSSVAVHVRHWVHVLWLNQLAPGILISLWLREHALAAVWKVLTGGSFQRDRIMQRLSLIHPTAKVHPSAYVEGCVVGPWAVVAAGASVRQSVVAEGAEVGEHATVLGSVIGCRTYVTPKTYMVWCALYPDSVVGNQKMQVSLVGSHAHVNAWVGLIDARFAGSIRVDSATGLQSTQRSFLGSCVGHHSQLAAKVLIHPGRVVPRGTVLVMRPDEVISTIPQTLAPGVPMVRDRGTLVPLASLKP